MTEKLCCPRSIWKFLCFNGIEPIALKPRQTFIDQHEFAIDRAKLELRVRHDNALPICILPARLVNTDAEFAHSFSHLATHAPRIGKRVERQSRRTSIRGVT